MLSRKPWSPTDSTDLSGTNELQDRWDFYGTPGDFNATFNPPAFYPGNITLANGTQVINPGLPQECVQQATAIGSFSPANPNNPTGRFFNTGCYVGGPGARSFMIAPAPGQFGTMARNLFYGPHFADWDFSIFKNWKFKERLTAQFRAEFFNILNHPIYANPGGPLGNTDPEAPSLFGCGCATPDVASTNPVLGTGAAREIQLGLKLLF